MNKQWQVAGMIAISTLGLIACENELPSGLPAIGDNEICISADIEEVHTRMDGSAFTSGDAVGVYVVEYVGDSRGELSNGTYKNNKFSFNGTIWTGASKMYWKTDKQVDVVGYYPYNATLVESTLNNYPWSIGSDQSTLDKLLKNDFLWGMKTTVPRSNAVPLTFAHKMSKIVINYRLGDGFTAFPQNMPIKVQTMNATESVIDLKTGIVTPAGRLESYQVYQMYETPNMPSDVVYSQQAIVLPQTMKAGDEFIVMTVPELGLFKYKLPNDITLQSASEYTFDITLTKGGVQVSIGSITDWTRPDRPTSGSATAVVPPVTADIDNAVNDYWDRISVTNKEEILIHYGSNTSADDPTRIYFKPEGQDKGYTLVFDKDGYPSKLLAGQSNDDKALAVFVPDLVSNPHQLGVGLITTPNRENPENTILMNKVDIPAHIPNGTFPEKLKDVVDVLVSLIDKNNIAEQIPPEQFGQDSELLDNLLDELEKETEQPNYTGTSGGSGGGIPGVDTALNDSINSLLGTQSPGGNNGDPYTPGQSQDHLNTTETSSTTGVEEAEQEFKDDIQMVESGVTSGFGDVKVTLTWNTLGDMDLHLKDPLGHIINYGNKTGDACGGYLDVDNQSGFMDGGTGSYNKPENIFYAEGKGKTGTYYIKIKNYNYSSLMPATGRGYTLYIYAFGKTKTYRGTLSGSKAERYFKFTVNGPANVEFSDDAITGQNWGG